MLEKEKVREEKRKVRQTCLLMSGHGLGLGPSPPATQVVMECFWVFPDRSSFHVHFTLTGRIVRVCQLNPMTPLLKYMPWHTAYDMIFFLILFLHKHVWIGVTLGLTKCDEM